MIDRLSCFNREVVGNRRSCNRDSFIKAGQDTDFSFFTQPVELAANTGFSCLNVTLEPARTGCPPLTPEFLSMTQSREDAKVLRDRLCDP